MSSLTQLIQQVGAGDASARDELFSAAYGELRKLARSRLRDGGRNTYLETTALVHESYLRFLNSGQLRIEDRRAFFAYASKVMCSVIVDAVRERQAQQARVRSCNPTSPCRRSRCQGVVVSPRTG